MLATPRDELYADLEVDRVLSEGQLIRHYGCVVADLSQNAFVFSAYLAPTHHSMSYGKFQFVTLERKVTALAASAIRHLAGVAEMRRLLNAPREQWRCQTRISFASEQPDALWERPEGDIAIEYDAGSYSPQQIRQKVYSFKHFKGQIWGSPSQRRVNHLDSFLQEAGETVASIFAPWF